MGEIEISEMHKTKSGHNTSKERTREQAKKKKT